MEGTFIKLDRKILNWEWFDDPIMFKFFVYLLLKANHKNRYWQGVEIKKGQLITSRLKLALALNLTERQIRTCINRLKTTNEITIETTNRFTLITICKYVLYQGGKNIYDQLNDQPNDQPKTNERPASDQRATTTKECKECNKNEKNEKNLGKSENENFEKKNKEDFQLNNFYRGSYKNAEKTFRGLSEKGFLQWVEFIDFVYKNGYSELFKFQCINPLDFEKINFPKKDWEEVVKAILGSGLNKDHNLRWRIPQFMGYQKNKKSDKSKGFHEVPENIDYDNLSMR